LHKERWLEHVHGVKADTAIALVAYSTKDLEFGGLHRRIHAFLADVQSRIRSYSLRRLIGTRPTSEHSHSYQRHHADVGFDTHKRYAFVIAGALLLLIRNVQTPNTEYAFAVPHDIKNATRVVRRSMITNPIARSSEHLYDEVEPLIEDEDSDDEEHFPDDEPLPDVLDDVLLMEDDDTGETDSVAYYAYGMSEQRPAPVFCDKTQELLRQLLYMLFTQNPNDGRDNPFRSVFVRYIVLSSVTRDGGWRTASVITQSVAAILFTGRLVIANEMLRQKALNRTFSYMK
jgi:hypothetical protein